MWQLHFILVTVGFFEMETFAESLVIYGITALVCGLIIIWYFRIQKRKSAETVVKIEKAKNEGLYEPVSLYPVVDENSCIRTGACIAACPEKDILGIVNGKATTINASQCVGHGACFQACPTQAITLCMGTEKRGVELPHVSQNFETNVPGIYIAGELGGMGLIKNAIEQGRQAVENMAKNIPVQHQADYDLVIVGGGPAGISALLTAKKLRLKAIALEQDSLGGTVFTFPRSKVVMTSAVELPLYGKVKLFETSKTELMKLWTDVLSKNNLTIKEHCKVDAITKKESWFEIETADGTVFNSAKVLLAIGRRGTPRKLGIPGEVSEKVSYRLLEPELISNKKIVVVGGGDSAIEAALLLSSHNEVMLSYRSDAFSRLKPKNSEAVIFAANSGKVDLRLNTQLSQIDRDTITLSYPKTGETVQIPNDLVFIFAGGELPTQFLLKSGILITKKFGEAVMKHQ